jgi:hypothetical protein
MENERNTGFPARLFPLDPDLPPGGADEVKSNWESVKASLKAGETLGKIIITSAPTGAGMSIDYFKALWEESKPKSNGK